MSRRRYGQSIYGILTKGGISLVEKRPLKGYRLLCAILEGAVLCITLLTATIRLLLSQLTVGIWQSNAWQALALSFGVALLIDLLCAPLRWGRRLWYYHLAAGEKPDGSLRFAFKHSGRAILWRALVLLCRSVVLAGALTPTAFALHQAAQLRILPQPGAAFALLAFLVVGGVAALLLVPAGLWLLMGLWPLAEVLADGGSLWQVCRRTHRLIHGRREEALRWWCKGIGWLLLSLIPLVNFWAAPYWQLHRARFLVHRQAALPPVRDGVKIYTSKKRTAH